MNRSDMWTADELRIIKEDYPTTPTSEVVRKLPGRTIRTVRERAHELGVRKRIGHRESDHRPPFLGRLSPVEIAYIAGIIDGEGCITLVRRAGKTCVPHLIIVNTNQTLRDWLSERLPDCFYDRQPKMNNTKRVWKWHIAGWKQVPLFLREIRDYLVIKQAQADLVIGVVDPGFDGDVQKVWDEVKKLNRKGIQ